MTKRILHSKVKLEEIARKYKENETNIGGCPYGRNVGWNVGYIANGVC